MFITENQNVGDSILFLLAARTALSNIVESSKNKNSNSLISFIQNEASDYQVMHLLLHGTLPKEKYNPVAETILFSDFKESMMMNKDFVTEMVGEYVFNNVLHEVDSLYMVTSTVRPVLEFAAQTEFDVALSCMISEAVGASKMAGDPSYLLQKIASYKQQLANAVGPAKAAIMKQIGALQAKYAALKSGIGASLKAATAGAGKGSFTGKGAYTAAPTLKAKVASAGKYYGGKVAAGAKGAGAAVGKFAATPAGLATGGAAAGALAIYAGYKVYKRFFSQAAKSCGGQSGAAKTACMNKFKKAAIMKQASAIQAASGTCAKSKNPAQCKAAVGKKVAQLKAKAAGIAA